MSFRVAQLAFMLGVGAYLAVVFINYGGYIDEIYRGQIDEMLVAASVQWVGLPPAEIAQRSAELYARMEAVYGIDQPFLLRCLRWTWDGLTFQWNDQSRFDSVYTLQPLTSREVILERLPHTLLLTGLSNLILFFAAILIALTLSRRYGSWQDRLMVALSPVSSIPNWAYGILLVTIFAGTLHWLPFSGMFDDFPPATPLGYVPIVLKHMILPVAAVFLSSFFQMVYTWRTFFLMYAGEDYVELAVMKGLPRSLLERRYMLRPVLPAILTSFLLLFTSFWQGSLLLEYVFNWPGIGDLFLDAVRSNTREITIGIIILYAYALAAAVFVLDILYALVDPRVRLSLPETTRLAQFTPRAKADEVLAWLKTWRWPEIRMPRQLGLPKDVDWSRVWASIGKILQQVRRYPTAVAGMLWISGLAVVSLATVIVIPYDEAVLRWRSVRPDSYGVAMDARPLYFNWFRMNPLPPTLRYDSAEAPAIKHVEVTSETSSRVTLEYSFDYPYQEHPQDLLLRFSAVYEVKKPFVTLEWVTPDGRTITIGDFSVANQQDYLLSQDIPKKLISGRSAGRQNVYQGTGGEPPVTILFSDPAQETPVTIQGRYTLRVNGLVFEPDSDLDAEFILYGQVDGWAGTDHRRRDLLTALLWGAPLALTFGVLGAFGTTSLALMFAALAAWFGGRWAQAVQLLNEVSLIIPALPIAIMVYYLYSKSIWAILSVFIILNVFGSAAKTYYAAFLQLKENPYVEAARAYGASHFRIITHYLMPRLLPSIIPQLAVLVPGYVFFEASLAFLNISDPYLPTWGKVVFDAMTIGAFRGATYWIMQPLALLLCTALAFAFLGFALERVFDPRLRNK